MKGRKSFHALDESCFMHVTETKYATSLTILSLLATLSQRTLETVGGVKMYDDLFNKTIIYEN